jgi:hypothetical protein
MGKGLAVPSEKLAAMVGRPPTVNTASAKSIALFFLPHHNIRGHKNNQHQTNAGESRAGMRVVSGDIYQPDKQIRYNAMAGMVMKSLKKDAENVLLVSFMYG